jgi:hypothetical protein
MKGSVWLDRSIIVVEDIIVVIGHTYSDQPVAYPS